MQKRRRRACSIAPLMSQPKSVGALLDLGERVLSDSTHIFEDHDNRGEAESLMAHVLDIDEDDLDADERPSVRERDRFLSLVARRAGGEPFPLLVGYIEFYGLRLEVKPGSFVPRPSSELTVERAVRRIRRRRNPVVVDLCSGAGPIALGIADDVPKAHVWGADIDADGLAQGRRNARFLDIENVVFKKGDMFRALPRRLKGGVDLITGHIPYVPPGEVEDLPSEVREHEPLFTLTDLSNDGLALIRRAVNEAPEWLKPGGWVLLEISEDLTSKIRRICRAAGFEDHGVAMDEDRLSVVIEARLPG
jgi:release factor glutamine methyltransferase